jgi:hypothetical protein
MLGHQSAMAAVAAMFILFIIVIGKLRQKKTNNSLALSFSIYPS